MPHRSSESLIAELKRYVRFDDEDAVLLRALCEKARPQFEDIAQDFYERAREHDEAHAVFRDEDQIRRLHASLVAWLGRVLTGPWDAAYCDKSLRIGKVHVEVGLPQRYMFTAMSVFRVHLERVAEEAMGERSRAACDALSRVLDIELAIMNESYREAILEKEVASEDAYRLAIAARGERSVLSAQQATERALSRYVHAVEMAGAVIIGLDTDGRIRLFNRRAEEVTAYRFVEVEGKRFADALLEDPDRCGFEELWESVLAEDTPVTLPARCNVRARNGKVREIAGHASRATNAGDIILVGRDVTDEELSAARVRQTERLAAVGTLAAGLAHEIRNPLNGAQLHLTFLKRALGKTEDELVEAVDVVAGEITRLSTLVSEFLDFARPSSLNLKVTNLQNLCRHAANFVETEGDKELFLELPKTALEVEIDPEKVEQVLLNLLGNAVDAAAKHVRIRAYREPRNAVIEISDDGPGLSNPEAPIFDAFFSTKATGTGLGLAIAHRIISDHAGTINYERRGQETVFRVTLPIAAPQSRRPAPIPNQEQ